MSEGEPKIEENPRDAEIDYVMNAMAEFEPFKKIRQDKSGRHWEISGWINEDTRKRIENIIENMEWLISKGADKKYILRDIIQGSSITQCPDRFIENRFIYDVFGKIIDEKIGNRK